MNRYQTIERRLGSLIIDLVILSPFILLDYLILSLELSMPLLIGWLLITNSAGSVYYTLLQGVYGQTLGKMLFRIKVVRNDDETSITIYQAFLREIPTVLFSAIALAGDVSLALSGATVDRTQLNPIIMNAFGFLAIPWVLAEVICTLKTMKRRAIHDFIARTVVIRTDMTSKPKEDQTAAPI